MLNRYTIKQVISVNVNVAIMILVIQFCYRRFESKLVIKISPEVLTTMTFPYTECVR